MNAYQPVYLTAEGVKNLRRELDHLVNVKRPALAERLRRAIQQGDLSENADYITAKEEQGFLEGRVQQIEAMLRRTVVEEGVEESEVFHIVGPAEADPANGKVSNESPLGRALMGRQVEDAVTVEAPGGEIVFRITAIQ